MCRYMGIYIDLIGMSQKEMLTNTICTCNRMAQYGTSFYYDCDMMV